MNLEHKVNAALGLSVLAIVLTIYAMTMGGFGSRETVKLSPQEFLLSQAKKQRIKTDEFEMCIKSPEIESRINEEIAEAGRLGGQGTPFNIIRISNGTLIPVSGALPYEAFEQVISLATQEGSSQEEILEIVNAFRSTQQQPLSELPKESDMRAFDKNRDYFKGQADADITIFEYSDYECPFCAQVHPTLDRLVENNPNIKWVYRNLPLSFHRQARPAARAALCIGQLKGNEAFWKFTDTIFSDISVLEN